MTVTNLATPEELDAAYTQAMAAYQAAAAEETTAAKRWSDLDRQLTDLEDRKATKNPAKRGKAIAALRLDVSDAWAAYNRLRNESRAAYNVLKDIMKAQGVM